jgi:TonB family protein
MNSLLRFTVSYLVNAVWEVALIYVAARLVSRLLKRLGPQAEHAAWVSTLVLAVVTPALPVLRLTSWMFLSSSAAAGVAPILFVPDPVAALAGGGNLSIAQNWLWWMLAFYFAATAFFTARLLSSLGATVRMRRQAKPAFLDAEQQEIWFRCRAQFSLRRARILVSSETRGPVALELRRPTLLLPAGFTGLCTIDDFLAAAAHECAHLKRRDFQKNIIYEALSLALGFHPLIWAIKSHIAQTREMICDAMATEGPIEAPIYARSLLRLAAIVVGGSRTSAIQAMGIFDAGILEKRIMRIRMKNEHTGVLARWGLIGAAGAILLFTAAGAAAAAVVIAPQTGSKESAPASPYGHVYHIGNGVSAPIPLNTVEAEFPKAVRKDKKVPGGIVLVRSIVDAEGMPQDVRVVRSYRPDFDAEALKAARKYRFKPAMLKGKPVAVSITIEVNFKRY